MSRIKEKAKENKSNINLVPDDNKEYIKLFESIKISQNKLNKIISY